MNVLTGLERTIQNTPKEGQSYYIPIQIPIRMNKRQYVGLHQKEVKGKRLRVDNQPRNETLSK